MQLALNCVIQASHARYSDEGTTTTTIITQSQSDQNTGPRTRGYFDIGRNWLLNLEVQWKNFGLRASYRMEFSIWKEDEVVEDKEVQNTDSQTERPNKTKRRKSTGKISV